MIEVNSVDTLLLNEMNSEDELDMALFDTDDDDGDLIDNIMDSNPTALFDSEDISDEDDEDEDLE